jgi:uncharacterized protein YndB with AHSA1/START domain
MIITIETTVSAHIDQVWNAWISPTAIEQWNFASDAWQCPTATVDLRVGERFSSRMEAKDGSMGFDFEGTFTAIDPQKNIEYSLDDDRKVTVRFEDSAEGVRVIETFEAEDELTGEQQRQGWQAILNNFKHYVESKND